MSLCRNNRSLVFQVLITRGRYSTCRTKAIDDNKPS